jgi:hypothetical protein
MNTFLECSLSAGLWIFGEPAIDFIHDGVCKLTNPNDTALIGAPGATTRGGQCLFGS